MPLTPALGQQRNMDLDELEVSLAHVLSSGPAKVA